MFSSFSKALRWRTRRSKSDDPRGYRLRFIVATKEFSVTGGCVPATSTIIGLDGKA